MDNPQRSPLPDGSMLNGELVITSYFDREGQLKYSCNVSGDINLAQALGLLELAKISVYESYMENEPYKPDGEEDE